MMTKDWQGKDIECDTTIKVGDRVRSYDFPDTMRDTDRPACYVEGTVTQIDNMVDLENFGCLRYHIKVERTFFAGEEIESTRGIRWVYPPVNGIENAMRPGSLTHGVVKI